MTHQFSITVSDFIWESYISETTGNRSAWISKLICLGAESMAGNPEATKQRVLILIQENNNLSEEIKKLNLETARLKGQLEKYSTDPKKIEKLQKIEEQQKLPKCINCGNVFIDDAKRISFPMGQVCKACFHTAPKDKRKQWLEDPKQAIRINPGAAS